MKKSVSILALFILSILVLAGCGGNGMESLPVAETVTNSVADTVAETADFVAESAAEVVPAVAPMDAPQEEPAQTGAVDNITTLDLQEAQDTLIALYETVNPAVVNIQVKAEAAGGQFGDFQLPDDFELPEGMNPEDFDPNNLPKDHPFNFS